MCTYTLHETFVFNTFRVCFHFCVFVVCIFVWFLLAAAQLALAIALSIARGGGLAERSALRWDYKSVSAYSLLLFHHGSLDRQARILGAADLNTGLV